MSPITSYLADRWFAVAILVAAAVLGTLSVWRRWRTLGALSVGLVLLGAGGLVLTEPIGRWIVFAALGSFLALVLVLVFTSGWTDRLAWSVLAVLLFGAGAYSQ